MIIDDIYVLFIDVPTFNFWKNRLMWLRQFWFFEILKEFLYTVTEVFHQYDSYFLARLFEEYVELLYSLGRRRRRPALVKVCVQPTYILKTTIATALKLGTLVHHHVPSVYAKNHNSNFHFDQIMALFRLRISG